MQYNKSKGFSLTEILISLVIMAIIAAITLPIITLRTFSSSKINKSAQNCILKDNGNNSTTDCKAAISACKFNKGNACTTLMSYNDSSSNTTQAVNSLKILREVCDNGGIDACDFFVNKCVQNNATCNLTGVNNKYYDLRYYLDLSYNSSNQGFLYLFKNAKNYFKRNLANIITAFSDAVIYASRANNAGYYFVNQLCNDTGDVNACNILNKSCLKIRDGNRSECISACDSDSEFNSDSCDLVKQACLTNPDNATSVSCNYIKDTCASSNDVNNPRCAYLVAQASTFASRIVNGCTTNIDTYKDCTLGYLFNWNKNCSQIKIAYPTALSLATGYKITALGSANPIQAQCDMGTDGGGWTLVLNYLHRQNTNPDLNSRSNSLPLQGSTSLGIDESGNSITWGHAIPYLMNLLNFSNVRFYCSTSHTGISGDTFNPSNVINFQTNACNDYFKTGSGYCNMSIHDDYTGTHNETNTNYPSTNTPKYIVNRLKDNGNSAMTKMPFIYLNRDSKDTYNYNYNSNYNYSNYYYNYTHNNSINAIDYYYNNQYNNEDYYNYNNNYYNYNYNNENYPNYRNYYNDGYYNSYDYYLSNNNEKAHAWNIGPVNSNNSIKLWACDDYPQSNYNTHHQIWVK